RRAGGRLAGAGRRWAAGPAAVSDDPVPAEVPALVVRLEPRADAVHEPRRRLLRAAERPLPVDGRPPVRPPRLRVPRRGARPQPLAAAGQVAARDPALLRAAVPLDRRLLPEHRGL